MFFGRNKTIKRDFVIILLEIIFPIRLFLSHLSPSVLTGCHCVSAFSSPCFHFWPLLTCRCVKLLTRVHSYFPIRKHPNCTIWSSIDTVPVLSTARFLETSDLMSSEQYYLLLVFFYVDTFADLTQHFRAESRFWEGRYEFCFLMVKIVIMMASTTRTIFHREKETTFFVNCLKLTI